MTTSAPTDIVSAERGRERRAFLRLPYDLYRDDPAWVPPLLFERRRFLDPRHNAFFAHAEVALFVARRDGQVVGRISAQRDREEERIAGAPVASFGLFEARDCEAAWALLDRAESWARERGAVRLRGPFALSVNQETGLLVEGFNEPPMLSMPHNRPEYGEWIESRGYSVVQNMYAWRGRLEDFEEVLRRGAVRARAAGRFTVRTLDPRRLGEEMRRVGAVFNQAWGKAWGHIPFTEAELDTLASDLKLVGDPRIMLIAEDRGEPVAIAIALPNLNEAIADLNGRLFPLGWAKLLYRLKVRGLKSMRVAILGVVERLQGMAGFQLRALLLTELHDRAEAAGYRQWEASWVREENRGANHGFAAAGIRRAMTYSVYEKRLAP